MANSNVRFYKLVTLPSFDRNKHKGIFVHVTGTMFKRKWGLSDNTGGYIEIDPATIYMTPEKVGGESVERINLVKWLEKRHIIEIASGLWFGGVNGWELLSNETTDAAINAAINTKIQGLDVEGYAQATIGANTTEGSESATGSTLTILGIQEVNGEISNDSSKNVNIAIDGVYNETDNKIATESTVTTAIGTLDVQTPIQAVTFNTPENGGNTVLTFNGIKEVDGKIAQGTSEGASTFIVGDAKLKIQIGSNEAGVFEVFSANAQSDGAIKLNEYVFKKDENNVISVITPTAVSERNRLVTEQDIANLSGAMHYKGSIASDTQWPANENVKAGDVYIVTTSFTHNGESNPFEVGDMIVFNGPNNYNVIQSNITLGTGDGQIAKNDGVLADGKLVVATENGIKTTEISPSVLEDANNTRDLTYSNGTADTDNTNNITLYHDVTIKDAFQVIGKDFTRTINISSANRSIEIAKKTVDGVDTGVVVDLVWNTIIE